MANEYAHLTLTDLLLHQEDKKLDMPKLRIFCLDLYQLVLILITSAMSLPGVLH